MKLRSTLILIWLAFLARGGFYATVIPIWEGLDEFAHFAYVDHLATLGTLPRPDDRVSEEVSRSLQLAPLPWRLQVLPAPSVTHDAYWTLTAAERSARESALQALRAKAQFKAGIDALYEGKQPPLYYLLCVPVLKLFGHSSLPARILALRLFTVLIASLVVPLTFAIANRVLGRTAPALLTTILLTSMPVLLMTASRVANDALAIVLFSVLAWALVRPNPWHGRGWLLIGITLGAGLLSKAYFVAAVPVVVCAAVGALWVAPLDKRMRTVTFVSAAALLALAISAWWYVRTLGASGPVWADLAPSTASDNSALIDHLIQMPWVLAVRGALDMHFWFSGWSFLFVRSWIYSVLRWVFLLLVLGGFLGLLRNRSSGLPVLWGLYGSFWLAMMYHSLVTFISGGVPSITGSYLYAVVACEGLILYGGICQWLPVRWQGRAMFALIGLFLLLEAYATHFVMIPYYTGMIGHRPDTSLLAFHISQGFQLGWKEIVFRLAVDKPAIVTPSIIAAVWVAFLAASAGLLVMAGRESSRSQNSSTS